MHERQSTSCLPAEDQGFLSNLLQMIQHAQPAPLSQEAMHLLLSKIDVKGFHRAKELYEMACYADSKHNYHKFALLTRVLANPLCQTIYDARLRCFSDYAEPTEPLNNNRATDIIQQLCHERDNDQHIKLFFDFFAAFRPIPCTQKYMVDIDINDIVNSYKIDRRDPASLKQLKYRIASQIESEDYYSSRTYDTLMSSIEEALDQLQVTLDEDIWNSDSPLSQHSLFKPPQSAMMEDDIQSKVTMSHH